MLGAEPMELGSKTGNAAKDYVLIIREMMKANPKAVSFYDFILDRGKAFRSSPVPDKLPKSINPKRFKVKECFYNAQMLALQYDYDYYEGFAVSIIPTEHAWALLPDGQLLDLTWDKVRNGTETFDYFGVLIPSKFIAKHMLETGMSTSMLILYWQSQGEKHGHIKDGKVRG